MSRKTYAGTECFVLYQTVKVTPHHKVKYLPKQLMTLDSHSAMPHSHCHLDTVSASHVSD